MIKKWIFLYSVQPLDSMFANNKLEQYHICLDSILANQDEDPDTDIDEIDIGDGLPDGY